jgi:chromatin remodeling complex protein RSC6
MIVVSQNPLSFPGDAMEVRFRRSQPLIQYSRIHIDSSKTSIFDVEINITHAAYTKKKMNGSIINQPEPFKRFARISTNYKAIIQGSPGSNSISPDLLNVISY